MIKNKKVLVTGCNGFIGSNLMFSVTPKFDFVGYDSFSLERISGKTSWDSLLKDIYCVVHLANAAHKFNLKNNLLYDSDLISIENLLHACIRTGVEKFIYVSSVNVYGNKSFIDINSNVEPVTHFEHAKVKSENSIFSLCDSSQIDFVIIRSPLVYGPNVKANFKSLMEFVSNGLPLPFSCITQNKRSLVSVANIVDLIITCIDHPKAANQVFLVSDDYDISTSEMVREMAIALDKPTWQLPVPILCYKLAGKLFKKSHVVDRLTGSLQVDISHTKDTLDWKPPQTLQDGFKQTAQAFIQAKTK